ncbi:MAG: DUF4435 domain-containing protein [Rikenellaceae bacterium]
MKSNKFAKQISSSYINAASHFITPANKNRRRVMVYVEGYEDIPFWREVLMPYESEKLYFEINVPSRSDLAKGKRVLMSLADSCGENLWLCMDSDFDYLFQGKTEQSKIIIETPYIIHTFAYSIENLLCYGPSLKNICVRAVKNDAEIFDFEYFIEEYSKIIYPLFLWYVYSALQQEINIFPLIDFRNAIRLNFVDIRENGAKTLAWMKKIQQKKLKMLELHNKLAIPLVIELGKGIKQIGIDSKNCYLYINGHALMDNIVVILECVAEVLKEIKLEEIKNSSRTGVTLANELNNYKNSLLRVSDLIRNNTNYKDSTPFLNIKYKIDKIIRMYKTNELII